MAVSSGNFAELLEPGLRRIYGQSYKDIPEEYSKVFNVETSTKAFEESLSLSGLGLAQVKAQGQGVAYEDFLQGYVSRLTHVAYGKGIIITSEMWEDDQYKVIRALPKALARSVRVTVEQVSANVLNRAFNSVYTGADVKELCATDHPLLGGGTSRNELTTPADLSSTSLEQALIDIADFVDDKGMLIQAKGVKLIVPPELDWTAKTLLHSSGDPESANRGDNPAKGSLSGGYMVYHYLTDPDAWFLSTDIPDGLIFYWKKRPVFTKDNDFDSDNAKWKVNLRMSVGWDDWRGIFGSPGA